MKKKTKIWIIVGVVCAVLVAFLIGFIILGILIAVLCFGGLSSNSENSWYTAPKELGSDGDAPRFMIDSKIYELPCPLNEFLRNGYSIVPNVGEMTDYYGDIALPKDKDDEVKYNSEGFCYVESDGIIIRCYFETEEDTKLKNVKVTSVQINAFPDENNGEVKSVFIPGSRGKVDVFNSSADEIEKMNAGEKRNNFYYIKRGYKTLDSYANDLMQSMLWSYIMISDTPGDYGAYAKTSSELELTEFWYEIPKDMDYYSNYVTIRGHYEYDSSIRVVPQSKRCYSILIR